MKAANIEVENSGAVVSVGSHLTVHNPLFFVSLQSPPSTGDKIIL